MKQQNRVVLKKTMREMPAPDITGDQPNNVLADSTEILEVYYRDRITSLTTMLNQLNLLQNPKDIVHLCKEIMASKKVLRSILLKKSFRL